MKNIAVAFLVWLLPSVAAAHEVYVLDSDTVAKAVSTPSPNPFLAYFGNEPQFFFWGFVTFVVASTILSASFFRLFERGLGPFFMHLKRFAHPLVRLTAGGTLLVFATKGVLYGPELTLTSLFGSAAPIAQIAVALIGAALVLGIYTRIAAFLAFIVFLAALQASHLYTLMYVGHAGAYALLMMLGAGGWSLASALPLVRSPLWMKMPRDFAGSAFPILRIAFGAGIMFAAVYAKFLHSNLALAVIERYDLTAYFPFEPLFIVLGAFIIELLAGLMIVLGIELRWTALFLVFWLTLGHLSMDEAWWVHLSLYGFGLAILFHGYDRYSLEGHYLKRGTREPVL